jgi:hypothetical protein
LFRKLCKGYYKEMKFEQDNFKGPFTIKKGYYNERFYYKEWHFHAISKGL